MRGLECMNLLECRIGTSSSWHKRIASWKATQVVVFLLVFLFWLSSCFRFVSAFAMVWLIFCLSRVSFCWLGLLNFFDFPHLYLWLSKVKRTFVLENFRTSTGWAHLCLSHWFSLASISKALHCKHGLSMGMPGWVDTDFTRFVRSCFIFFVFSGFPWDFQGEGYIFTMIMLFLIHFPYRRCPEHECTLGVLRGNSSISNSFSATLAVTGHVLSFSILIFHLLLFDFKFAWVPFISHLSLSFFITIFSSTPSISIMPKE